MSVANLCKLLDYSNRNVLNYKFIKLDYLCKRLICLEGLAQVQFQQDTLSTLTSDTLLLSDSASVVAPIQNKTFFTTESLKGDYFNPVEIQKTSNDWIAVHLIILFVLLAWVRFFYRKRLSQVFSSVVAHHYFYQLTREGTLFRERISIPLFIVYLVSVSMFIYLLVICFLPPSVTDLQDIKLFSAIILIVLVFWIIKNGVINLSGIIFKDYYSSAEILLTNFVFNLVLGLVFLPVVVIAVYYNSENILYAGVIFWLILTLYRIGRELYSSISLLNYSVYYRILYLCTLEILPLLVVTKLVIRVLG
jgi:hypothetical protein